MDGVISLSYIHTYNYEKYSCLTKLTFHIMSTDNLGLYYFVSQLSRVKFMLSDHVI